MLEQAYAGWVAAANTPTPTTATVATTTAAISQLRYRSRNERRATGRDRSRRPARCAVPEPDAGRAAELADAAAGLAAAVPPVAFDWPAMR
jgi:hypothetical protein